MINYRMVQRKDPRDSTAPVSHHACALSSGTTDMRGIAQKISERCTLTTVDVVAVLEALLTMIPQELAQGRIVQLGDFGTFRVTLRSKGAETPELFSKSLIKEAKIHFLQGTEFRKNFQNLNFSKQTG